MRVRIGRLSTFTLISLLLSFGFPAMAREQDEVSSQLKSAPGSQRQMKNAHKTGFTNAAPGYSYSILYSFCSAAKCADGKYPEGVLVQDAAGNLYGTTVEGGDFDGGTVFKLDTTGHQTVLYTFCSAANCTDGASPYAGEIRDALGNLYGTTMNGGNSNPNICPLGDGCGTVFKLDTTGHETVPYSFCSAGGANCTDGTNPWYGSLIQDAAGNLYGTTVYGGTSSCLNSIFKTCGTVFKLDTTGDETVLYSFGSYSGDGVEPYEGLIQDPAGNLYGTTPYTNACCGGGTVFKVDTAGQETVLYTFCSAPNCTDGREPETVLVQDGSGNLYGTTTGGGANSGANGGFGGGTVFKVDATGQETVLYSFCSAAKCADGTVPAFGLILDATGNLYGTAGGGARNKGVVFKIAPPTEPGGPWTETVLHNFCSSAKCADGSGPYGLVQDAAGNLYGTAVGGGVGKGGTVFKLTPTVATTTTLSSSPNPSTYGEPVTFTAVVASSAGTPPNGESVSFKKGGTVLGTGTLNGGSASFTTSTLNVGTTTVKAVYGGDIRFLASTSNPVKQVVKKAGE